LPLPYIIIIITMLLPASLQSALDGLAAEIMMLSEISPEKVKPVVLPVKEQQQSSLDYSNSTYSLSLPMEINFEAAITSSSAPDPATTATTTNVATATTSTTATTTTTVSSGVDRFIATAEAGLGDVPLLPGLLSDARNGAAINAPTTTVKAPVLQSPDMKQGLDNRNPDMKQGLDNRNPDMKQGLDNRNPDMKQGLNNRAQTTVTASSIGAAPLHDPTITRSNHDPPVSVPAPVPVSAAAPTSSSIDPALIEVLSLIQQHIHHLQDQQNGFEKFVTEQFTQLQQRMGSLEHQQPTPLPPPTSDNAAAAVAAMTIQQKKQLETTAGGGGEEEEAVNTIEDKMPSKGGEKTMQQVTSKAVKEEDEKKMTTTNNNNNNKKEQEDAVDPQYVLPDDRQYVLMTEMIRRLELLESVIRHSGTAAAGSPAPNGSLYNGSLQRKYLSDAHEHRLDLMEQLVSPPTSSNNSPIDMKRTTARKDYMMLDRGGGGGGGSSPRSPQWQGSSSSSSSPSIIIEEVGRRVSPDRPAESSVRGRRVDYSPNPMMDRRHASSSPSPSFRNDPSISGEAKISSSSPLMDRDSTDGSRLETGYDGMSSRFDREMERERDRERERERVSRISMDPDTGVIDRRRYNRHDNRSYAIGEEDRERGDSSRPHRHHSNDRGVDRSDCSDRRGRGRGYVEDDRSVFSDRKGDGDHEPNSQRYRGGVGSSWNARSNSNIIYPDNINASYLHQSSNDSTMQRPSYSTTGRRDQLPSSSSLEEEDDGSRLHHFPSSPSSIKPISRRLDSQQSFNSDHHLSQQSQSGPNDYSPERGQSSPTDPSSFHAGRSFANSTGSHHHQQQQQRVPAPSYMRPTTSQAIRLSQSTDVPKFDDFWLNPSLR
jgi:hypothetical protein